MDEKLPEKMFPPPRKLTKKERAKKTHLECVEMICLPGQMYPQTFDLNEPDREDLLC